MLDIPWVCICRILKSYHLDYSMNTTNILILWHFARLCLALDCTACLLPSYAVCQQNACPSSGVSRDTSQLKPKQCQGDTREQLQQPAASEQAPGMLWQKRNSPRWLHKGKISAASPHLKVPTTGKAWSSTFPWSCWCTQLCQKLFLKDQG